MKKLISLVLVCIMIMSMTACASTRRFESESAMMEHLNGMWVLDDTYEDKTYYVFHDGEVYNFNDVQFCGSIEGLFSSFVADEKIAELSKLDYKSAMDILGANEFLGNPEGIIAKPKKGMIIVDEGKTYEKQIIITEDGVFVKAIGEDEGIALTKLSNTADFTGEHFTELFEKTKKNYTIPTYTFLKTPAEYAQMYVDELIFEKQITETSYKLYHMNGYENGDFAWDDVSFLYTTGKEASSDGDPTFQLSYKPNADSTQLIISEKLWPDFEHLLDKYAMPILSDIPWAIGTEEIMARFERKAKTTNGVRSCSFVENDIEYGITIDYNKYIPRLDKSIPFYEFPQAVMITVSFNSSIDLSSIDVDALVSLSQYCSQCQNTAPNVTFFSNDEFCDNCNNSTQENIDAIVQTAPMSEVPYTTSISGATPIYSQPDSGSSFVQNVGLDGIYTIVEEAYDSEGNLWGKLKSGLGWVDLSSTKDGQLSGSPISANFAPVSVLSSDHHEVILDNSEYMVKVAFWAHDNLSNVQFSSLQFDDNSYQVAEILYALPELTPDKPLVIGVSFPGPASIFGISFTDSSGATRCYAVFTSGRNGELVLEEYN